jgi:hypothetical protein
VTLSVQRSGALSEPTTTTSCAALCSSARHLSSKLLLSPLTPHEHQCSA